MRIDVSDNYSKVPLMGDAPLLGPLFRNKSLSKTKTDLLIFLTPTIVHPDQRPATKNTQRLCPKEQVFTNDKWIPKDNAEPGFFGLGGYAGQKEGVTTNTVEPTRNFGPK